MRLAREKERIPKAVTFFIVKKVTWEKMNMCCTQTSQNLPFWLLALWFICSSFYALDGRLLMIQERVSVFFGFNDEFLEPVDTSDIYSPLRLTSSIKDFFKNFTSISLHFVEEKVPPPPPQASTTALKLKARKIGENLCAFCIEWFLQGWRCRQMDIL